MSQVKLDSLLAEQVEEANVLVEAMVLSSMLLFSWTTISKSFDVLIFA